MLRVSLTAAAAGLAPLHPPRDWFDDPRLDHPAPLTVTDDGRVYGHAWTWNSCHTGFPGACVTAPRSRSDYAYFHLGSVRTADGTTLDVGKITLDTGHAGLRLNAKAAAEHYDHTGAVVADVRVGEDQYGGWVAGAVRPSCDAERIRAFMAAPVSGDWRQVNGALELVGLLAVNVPGYPVPRPAARVASGVLEEPRLALVAAGLLSDYRMTDAEAERRIGLLAAKAEGIDALAALAE